MIQPPRPYQGSLQGKRGQGDPDLALLLKSVTCSKLPRYQLPGEHSRSPLSTSAHSVHAHSEGVPSLHAIDPPCCGSHNCDSCGTAPPSEYQAHSGKMGCTTQWACVPCKEGVPGRRTSGTPTSSGSSSAWVQPVCQRPMGPWARACRWTVCISLSGPETGFLGFSPSSPLHHHHHSVVLPPSGASQLRKVTVLQQLGF